MIIDGRDPFQHGNIIELINVWNWKKTKVLTKVNHGDTVSFIERKGDKVKIRTNSVVGWVTYKLIKELKEEWYREVLKENE